MVKPQNHVTLPSAGRLECPCTLGDVQYLTVLRLVAGRLGGCTGRCAGGRAGGGGRGRPMLRLTEGLEMYLVPLKKMTNKY